MRHSFENGKYTVISDNGKLTALRYGAEWQDLSGNNLVYWMLVEVDKLKKGILGLVDQSDIDFYSDDGAYIEKAYTALASGRRLVVEGIASEEKGILRNLLFYLTVEQGGGTCEFVEPE